jgi:chemotaxis protein MotB
MGKTKSKSNNESSGGGGAPAWMTTYGDMMTLLLCFFVLLVSFSSIEKSGFDKAMGSLKGALGVLPKHQSVMIQFDPIIPQLTDYQKKRIQKVISELRNVAKNQGLRDNMTMQQTKDGILIRIDSPVLFDLGNAELKKKSFPVLLKVLELAKDWPNSIRIEGHTDNLKISTGQFPSNWELSTARALSVLRFFLHQGNIEPQRLKAVGYGEYHPIMSNQTAANRAKNRRVEIYFESNGSGNQGSSHDELFLR